MIDRGARDKTALLLRRLVAGRLTNDEFEDAYPLSQDAGVEAIRRAAWHLYSDLREHRLAGRDAISRANRRRIGRWVAFLHNDREYEWPVFPLAIELIFGLIGLATLGLFGLIIRHAIYVKAGDLDCWPFIGRVDLGVALARPRLLAGR